MQKHPKKRYGRSERWHDANTKVDPDTVRALRELVPFREDADFDYAYLHSCYRSKHLDETVVPSSERRANAIRKFREVNETNRETNHRLSQIDPGFNILPRVTYKQFLSHAKAIIAKVLGPLTDSVVCGGFSGGASTSRSRKQAGSHPASKFDGQVHLTESITGLLDVISRNIPVGSEYGLFSDLIIQNEAILFTVPKKTDIDRCASKEPDVNMFLQKGVGNHIRRALRRVGIDLNDQSNNRFLAFAGSVDNSVATLDLSSASDTVSVELVRTLLPDLWFLYLDDIRTKSTLIDGEPLRLEMFSTMGNGFTFELESLLFYSIIRTVAYFDGRSGAISVFGDDLIFPSGMTDYVTYVLQLLGFTVNQEKSFSDGPFRESCGGHYHAGKDVTPFYLREDPRLLTDVIRMANQLYGWLEECPSRVFAYPELVKAWGRLRARVPRMFWGGADTAVDTQLVDDSTPQRALQRVKRHYRLSTVGSYLQWHCVNWNRTEPLKEPSQEELPTWVQRARKEAAKRPTEPIGPHIYGTHFYADASDRCRVVRAKHSNFEGRRFSYVTYALRHLSKPGL